MASSVFKTHFVLRLVLVFSLLHMSFGTRKLTGLWKESTILNYHNGPLLYGNVLIDIVWYGEFSASQHAIICDFITSFSSPAQSEPSVATWFATVNKYYHLTEGRIPSSVSISLGNQQHDKKYKHGKSLTQDQIKQMALAARGHQTNVIVVVLTAADVTVQEFCMICGTHGSSGNDFVYIWVGNSETQCPGQCAWPFHQPLYGPQVPPLIPPNDDMGTDGMVINIGRLIVGAITNPYGNGIYQGVANAPMEACTACPGIYGPGAYPGYPGQLLVDTATGCSHNTYGASGRKYLVPAMFDPTTSNCSTLV